MTLPYFMAHESNYLQVFVPTILFTSNSKRIFKFPMFTKCLFLVFQQYLYLNYSQLLFDDWLSLLRSFSFSETFLFVSIFISWQLDSKYNLPNLMIHYFNSSKVVNLAILFFVLFMFLAFVLLHSIRWVKLAL